MVQNQIAKLLYEVIVKDIMKNPDFIPKNILELGCGTGKLTSFLFDSFPYSNIIISDYSKNMLDIAKWNLRKKIKKHKGNVEFRVVNATEILDTKKTLRFDLITSSMVFQWFNNPIEILKLWRYFLSENGLLAISTLGYESFSEVKEIAKKAKSNIGFYEYLPSINYLEEDFDVIGYNIYIKYNCLSLFFKTLIKTGASGKFSKKFNSELKKLLKYNNDEILINWDVLIVLYNNYKNKEDYRKNLN